MENGDQHASLRIAQRAALLPPAERAAFVREACAGDAALMDAVRRALEFTEAATLVPEDQQAGGAEERPSILDSAPLHRTIAPGVNARRSAGKRRIAGFEVGGVLGEGGMGTVYLAEQERPKRTVALKVVRAGRMTASMLRRFEHEAEILARLQHPGIAQIYQAGTFDEGDGPIPYYAMEFVQGPTLADAATRLTRDQKLDLFIRICDAVQHAHQKGVIHRDLKPSNILVDQAGQPKVLDFGVARLADAERSELTYATAAGQLVGTLPYMSPEQVAGDPNDLDTRSDVYALGVILYELLTGQLPHNVPMNSLVDAVKTITESRIAPLSSIDRSLGGDLQTIVGKALEKDREQRYHSAAELGADLERFLRDEPIQARPPTRTYLLTKFVRRNKPLVALGAAAAVALAAGVAGTAWQAYRATEGQRLAELRRNEAERARYEAQAALADSQAVTEFLTNMLASVDPETARGEEISVREILDQTATTLPMLADRPRVELAIRTTLGSAYRALGRFSDALPQIVAARKLAESVHGPESVQALTLARGIAITTSDLNDPTSALEQMRHTVASFERVLGPGAPETALAIGDLGRLLVETGNMEEAEKTLRRAIELTRATLGPENHDYLTQRDHLGALLTDLGRFAEGEEVLRSLLADRRAVFGPDSPTVAYTITTLANVVQKQGRNAEAIELLTESLRVRRISLAPDHPSLLINLANLATALIGSGRAAEALPLLRETVAKQREVLGDDSPKVLVSMGTLAYALEELEELDEAESIYRHIVEIGRRLPPAREAETLSNFNNLAMLLWARGKLDEAEQVFDETITRALAALPPEHYICAIFRNNYGEFLTERGKLAEAEPHLIESHAALVAFFGAEHPRAAKSAGRLVKFYEASGRGPEAEAMRQGGASQAQRGGE
jgi:tetratricopeptide (TPR) repeat protein/predicted Ser/Thr protein kinase